MFVVLYRWRIKEGMERQFVETWSERTAYLLEKYGSLGSRLHRGNDGICYSYAQWKSEVQRKRAFKAELSNTSETRRKFQEAVDEEFPEVELEVISDYLILSENL